MAHNLDITNGQASYVGARQDAWHMLGKTLPDTFTAEEAMREGLLGGWNVRKVPLLGTDPETGLQVPIPDRYGVLRTNPVDRARVDGLGVVGNHHRIIQNEEHADFLNALVDESGAHFETAGALEGGRKVFVTMKLPGHISVGGVDRVENYIAAVNSYDGSMAFTLLVTPVRIVCQNTLNMAFGDRSHIVRIRHTSGYMNQLNKARETLDLTFNYLDAFQAEAERMINTTLSQNRFEEIIATEFGAPRGAPAATITRRDNQIDEMARLFSDAFTQEGLRETAWAGFNALTEWYDHYSPTKGDDREKSRAVNAVFFPDFKAKALALMQAG